MTMYVPWQVIRFLLFCRQRENDPYLKSSIDFLTLFWQHNSKPFFKSFELRASDSSHEGTHTSKWLNFYGQYWSISARYKGLCGFIFPWDKKNAVLPGSITLDFTMHWCWLRLFPSFSCQSRSWLLWLASLISVLDLNSPTGSNCGWCSYLLFFSFQSQRYSSFKDTLRC